MLLSLALMLRRFTNLGHFHLIAFHGMLVREVKNRLLKVIEAKVLTENFVWHPLGHLNMLFRPPLLMVKIVEYD